MKRRLAIVGFILTLFLFINCENNSRKVPNVMTFAKVYGYVRWFYPSDEAAKTDWNKFARYGIHRVENAKNAEELRHILLELFIPIAPALQIISVDQSPDMKLLKITRNDTSGLRPVAWVHYSGNFGKFDYYKSVRINRDSLNIKGAYHIPKNGENITKEIGNHLKILMPLALYCDEYHTFPISDSIMLKQLKYQINKISESDLTTQNIEMSLANVVISWNVFQHFYPYFDILHVNWESELEQTLNSVYVHNDEIDNFKAISKMIAKLEDGHGTVYSNRIKQWLLPKLPINVDLVENEIVVISSNINKIQKGDLIKKIDGKSALKELQEQESLISGSPQLKRFRALSVFSSDFSKSESRVTLIRNNHELQISAMREIPSEIPLNILFSENQNNEITSYGDSIYYLNHDVSDMNLTISKFTHAKGVIIGPGFSNLESQMTFISHFIKEPVWSPWLDVPIYTYPDRENVTFDSIRWSIKPTAPYINAKLALLTYSFQFSQEEILPSIVNFYKLGKLVGDTTGGANGAVNSIELMGGYVITWTGTKVLKQDKSQHMLIGIRPDYPVIRTITAINENRGEYLEKAIDILKK